MSAQASALLTEQAVAAPKSPKSPRKRAVKQVEEEQPAAKSPKKVTKVATTKTVVSPGSKKTKKVVKEVLETQGEDAAAAAEQPSPKKGKKTMTTTTTTVIKKKAGVKTKTTKKVKAETTEDAAEIAEAEAVDDATPKVPRKMASMPGIPREVLQRPAPHASGLKMVSWNVAGLRALLRSSKSELLRLIEEEKPDMLFLQETKLQDDHVPPMQTLLPGYKSYWSCSSAKKGLSGTAVFIKDKLDHNVTFGLGVPKHDDEGRTITVELKDMYVVGLYVPNSGMPGRLDYRLQEWNPALLEYVKKLDQKKPVVVTGDLNVAHLDHDIYNVTQPHIKKSAGCTPGERNGFTEFLSHGFVDTFRHLYPEAKGQFTYWSRRTGGRAEDRGLRLDYFVASRIFCDPAANQFPWRLHDSYMLPEIMGSDHCPVAVTLAPRT